MFENPPPKRKKDKIAPLRFAPLRNFSKSSTPPFLCRISHLLENQPPKLRTKKPGKRKDENTAITRYT